MGVSSLPKTVTRQRRDCDLNPGPSAPESSTLTTRLSNRHNVRSSNKVLPQRRRDNVLSADSSSTMDPKITNNLRLSADGSVVSTSLVAVGG